VQNLSSPAVRIQLTPMQIPEAVPGAGLTFDRPERMDAAAQSLVLHPGEPSEMIVQVQNLEPRPLRVSLKVEGNFPLEWCQIGGTEGNEIPAGGQMDAVLRFSIPATFFEDGVADFGYDFYLLAIAKLLHGQYFRLLDFYFHTLIQQRLEDQQAIVPGQQDRLNLNFRSLVTINIESGTDRSQIQHSDYFDLYVRPYSAYMEFLPVLYREVDFIGRFMKIFEQAYQPAIDSFNVLWANLDPLTAPKALLPFLAHWVAWPVDSVWDLHQQRRLIRRAVELYRWRGTRKGLRLYLHLYTGLPLDENIGNEADKHISITEPFGPSFILGSAQLGSAILAGGEAFHFIVRLRPNVSNINLNEQLIRRIIDQEKPAFCTYELVIENFSS
jgi:phage tail-like protein